MVSSDLADRVKAYGLTEIVSTASPLSPEDQAVIRAALPPVEQEAPCSDPHESVQDMRAT